MKKAYSEPLMEAVDIKMNQQLLAGSVGNNADIDPMPLPGDGTGGSGGRAPGLFDDPAWDALFGE
jgi:hypothetical protein